MFLWLLERPLLPTTTPSRRRCLSHMVLLSRGDLLCPGRRRRDPK